MSKKIAVAIVHGTGRKGPDFADDTMKELQERFPAHLSDAYDDAELVMEPVYWADITRQREDEIWNRVKKSGPMQSLKMRRFIFNVTGDTLAYQPSEGRRKLYLEVHEQMAGAFKKLAKRAGPEAPLCVLAHSMGTIVAHNFCTICKIPKRGDMTIKSSRNRRLKDAKPLQCLLPTEVRWLFGGFVLVGTIKP